MYNDPVLYQPMTEADGEAGRFLVELRNRLAPYRGLMRGVVSDGLNCDGDHHARWYLERIADLLGVPVNDRRGIAP